MAEGPDFELAPTVLVKSYGGCGAQFNQHTYAAISGVAEEHFHDLEVKVRALRPQLVRMFYNPQQDGNPADPNRTKVQANNWDSVVRTAKLARDAGATINVTWQSGPCATPADRKRSMTIFADVLDRLASKNEIHDLRWVTIQNEPNTAAKKGKQKDVTPDRLAEMYELLDTRLTANDLRKQIRFMGGDLIEGSTKPDSPINQQKWLEHMSKHNAGLFDAYSVHIYWDYDHTGRFEKRLTDVRGIVDHLEHKKPLYVTEYGMRGKNRGTKGVVDPGHFVNGKASIPICETNITGFQNAWFQIRAAQLRFAGTIKWDCHFGKYDRGNQAYYAIGRPTADGWQAFPAYHALRLVTLTTEVGCNVREVHAKNPGDTRKLVAFGDPKAELTVLGLDSRGAPLNGTSSTNVLYAIGGLPAGKRFQLVVWNRRGGGKLALDDPITTSPQGVARLTVPLHAAFALTTKELPPL
jgi:hypothetical protein